MIDPIVNTEASIPVLRLAYHVLSDGEESELLHQIEQWSDGGNDPCYARVCCRHAERCGASDGAMSREGAR
jgi:hypothetical protein